MTVEQSTRDRAEVAQCVLDDLPDWFGREDARRDNVNTSRDLPMFVAKNGLDTLGFLSLRTHTTDHAEIFVMGVRKAWHRRRIGTALVTAAVAHARASGISFMTVKTVAESVPDPNYAATRAFYKAMGFRPFEILDTLWDADTPCVVMMRQINETQRRETSTLRTKVSMSD